MLEWKESLLGLARDLLPLMRVERPGRSELRLWVGKQQLKGGKSRYMKSQRAVNALSQLNLSTERLSGEEITHTFARATWWRYNGVSANHLASRIARFLGRGS